MGASTRWTSGRSGTTRVASTRSKGSSSQPSRTSSLTKARTPLCAHFGISRRQPGQGVHQHALVQRQRVTRRRESRDRPQAPQRRHPAQAPCKPSPAPPGPGHVRDLSGIGLVVVDRNATSKLAPDTTINCSPSFSPTAVGGERMGNVAPGKSTEIHHTRVPEAQGGDNVGFNIMNIHCREIYRGAVVGNTLSTTHRSGLSGSGRR